MMGSLKYYSVEFFPPKTDRGRSKLEQVISALSAYQPSYFSVTYGAGGSTQAFTLDTLRQIQRLSSIEAAPHLSCIGSSQTALHDILQEYKTLGIKRIIALRGDLPSGNGDLGDFRYANELVQFIREETGEYFTLEVAAYPEVHPQALNWAQDLEHFKRKVDAGANSAITQYFYNPECFFRFINDCQQAGINIPIIPGIMPITNARQLLRFSDACGTEIPRWIRKRLEYYAEDLPSIRAFGEEVVTSLCEKLIDQGVDNLHFYAMNQSEIILKLWQNLGLSPQTP